MENDEETQDGLIPRRSPERRRQDLVEALAELRLTTWGLVRKLEKFGDDRPSQAIARSIERMISGETKVSAEMSVIMSMLLRQHRRLNERYADLEWKVTEHGAYQAQIDNWHVSLTPQTRGRWALSCASGPTRQDYSPQWGHWIDSFELAKHKALVEVEEGMNELAEINHERRQQEAS